MSIGHEYDQMIRELENGAGFDCPEIPALSALMKDAASTIELLQSVRNAQAAMISQLHDRHMRGKAMLDAIDYLRQGEGASIEIHNDRPGGDPKCSIEVRGEWTNGEPVGFTGDLLLEALSNAYEAKKAAT